VGQNPKRGEKKNESWKYRGLGMDSKFGGEGPHIRQEGEKS